MNTLTELPSAWVIVGTGAIGSILGARLIQQKQNVHFVVRANANNEKGSGSLHLSVTGHTNFSALVSSHTASSLAAIPANAVWVFAVKAWQLKVALKAYSSALAQAKHIIISHNGLGAAETEIASLGTSKVIDWVTTHGGWRRSPQHTEHSGQGQSWLGFRCSVQAQGHPAPTWWPIFARALAPTDWQADIALRRWHKLAINCAINPIAALANSSNGALREPQYADQIQQVCKEVAAVMSAELSEQINASELFAQVQQVIQATANNINSMLQDIRAGRPTEVEYLNGFVHKKGRQHNVPTPVNTMLWQAIRNR